MRTATLLFCSTVLVGMQSINGRFSEPERVEYWRKHHTWPPQWHVENDGYRALMEQREADIMKIPASDERWENWMQYIMQRMVPSFTEHGFELTQMPKDLYNKVKAKVDEGLEHWDTLRSEAPIDVVNTKQAYPSKMIDLGPLSREVHEALKPMHEAWSGIELRPTSIYGVRCYQNGSSLLMHVDKPQTHVISSILHFGHHYDDDNQPWPIEVEDLNGKLHQVNLEEGNMVFYESAKSLHGRMKTLKGKYYCGMFVHYQPVDKSVWNFETETFINAIPPHWSNGVKERWGSRWAGQCITTDSRQCEGVPPRVVGEENPRNSYNALHGLPETNRPPKLDNWYENYPGSVRVDL